MPDTRKPMSAKPLARSPLERALREQGAAFIECEGWWVAQHFGDAQLEVQAARRSAGICDLSSATKWDICGTDLTAALAETLPEHKPKPGEVTPYKGGYICQPSREHGTVVNDSPDVPLITEIQNNLGQRCLHLVNRTSGFARVLLCGPQSRSVLRKLTPLDLRDNAFAHLRCAWTSMAEVRVLLVRNDRQGTAAYEVLVSRDCAEYLWKSMLRAGQEFGIVAMGSQGLGMIEAA